MARSDRLKRDFYEQELPVAEFLPASDAMVQHGEPPPHLSLPLDVMLLGSFDPGVRAVMDAYEQGAPRLAEKLHAHHRGCADPRFEITPIERMLVLARVLQAMGHKVVEGNFANRHVMNLDEQVRQLIFATDVRVVLLRNSGGTLIEVGQILEWSRMSAPTHFGGWQDYSDRNGRPFGDSTLYLRGSGNPLTSYVRLGHGLLPWMNLQTYDSTNISELVTLVKRWIMQQQVQVTLARSHNPKALAPNPLFRGQARFDSDARAGEDDGALEVARSTASTRPAVKEVSSR